MRVDVRMWRHGWNVGSRRAVKGHRKTEERKKGWSRDAPILCTCLWIQVPVCFDLARMAVLRLALLCLMQAPGTGAREETLSPALP
jgi:hypothetical protein